MRFENAVAVRVAEAPASSARTISSTPSGTRMRGSKPSMALHLLEADLVVARVLVAVDVADVAAPEPLGDHLDEVELAVVLVAVADVEDLAGDQLSASASSTVQMPRAASRTWT